MKKYVTNTREVESYCFSLTKQSFMLVWNMDFGVSSDLPRLQLLSTLCTSVINTLCVAVWIK